MFQDRSEGPPSFLPYAEIVVRVAWAFSCLAESGVTLPHLPGFLSSLSRHWFIQHCLRFYIQSDRPRAGTPIRLRRTSPSGAVSADRWPLLKTHMMYIMACCKRRVACRARIDEVMLCSPWTAAGFSSPLPLFHVIGDQWNLCHVD